MDKAVSIMDGTRISGRETYRDPRCRLPSPRERALGLWVDRVGAALEEARRPAALRVLGQFACVGVVEGTGCFESVGAGVRHVSAGDVLLLFPHEPARYWSEGAWATCWAVWNGPEAECVARLAGLTPESPVLRAGAAALQRVCSELGARLADDELLAVLERKALLLGGLAEMLRLHVHTTGGAGRDLVTRAVAWIGGRGGGRFTVTELAAAVHVSPSQLRRLFRRHTGRSPQAYVVAQRMAQAQALLAGGATIKAAATATGYTDVCHFMRVFRRTVGQTAGRFARNTCGRSTGAALPGPLEACF